MLLYSSFTPARTSTLYENKTWPTAHSLYPPTHCAHTHTQTQLVALMSFSYSDCDEVINFVAAELESRQLSFPFSIRESMFTIIILGRHASKFFHLPSDITHKIGKYFLDLASSDLIGWL